MYLMPEDFEHLGKMKVQTSFSYTEKALGMRGYITVSDGSFKFLDTVNLKRYEGPAGHRFFGERLEDGKIKVLLDYSV